MTSSRPSVNQLPLHLPHEQSCIYQPTLESATEALKQKKYTMLTEYFVANSIYGELAQSLKYEDFPIKFVWQQGSKMWTPRVRGTLNPEAIGNMVTIHPTAGDIFYLRVLLKNRSGAVTFDDLKTVEGINHEDFKSACISLGLCEDDSEWINCMNEAKEIAHPWAIRKLFCSILINCEPASPAAIYEQFKDDMSEDFLRKRRQALNLSDDEAREIAYNDLLHFLNDDLGQCNKGNANYKLPIPREDLASLDVIEDTSEYDPDAQAFFDKYYETLNTEQMNVFTKINEDIHQNKGGLHRLDAPAGSGKTHLANLILASVRKENKIALATALSGIAATILKLGKTFHRQFGVPIPIFNDSTSNLKLASKEAKMIINAAVIMIDEVAMMHWKLLTLLNRFLQTLMKNNTIMGGKVVILMGDLRQCPPVVTGGKRPDIVSASVVGTDIWNQFTIHNLRKNMRVESLIARDPHRAEILRRHAAWLLRLGNGNLPTIFDDIIEIPKQMVCSNPQELENKVYDNFEENMTNIEYLSQRSIMSSTNDTIQERNFEFIKKLPGDMQICYSRDTCIDDDHATLYDPEFLNKVNVSGLPPHRLPLKKGACIILIKNLDIRNGHCNGTRYIILELSPNVIKAQKLSGGSNSIILIPRIPIVSKDSSFPVPFKRVQFPVLLAYYLTINRAQGQTLQHGGLFLPRSVFYHGHLYVGFGRCGDPDCFFVFADQGEFDNIRRYLNPNKTYTRNIIYPELLQK